jgi:hypothetical protein
MAGPEYRHQYVSAAVSMGPIITGTEWALDIFLANRGETIEHLRVQILRGGAIFETFQTDDVAVEPLRTGGWGFGFETDPGIADWELWWVSILTTSLNLVPTMRFHVENVDATPPPVPEFFFGPGDFAVFPVRVLPEPPIVGGSANALTEG